MQSSFNQSESIFLLLLLFVVGFGTLAQRMKRPYPIVLVIAGLALSLIPGLPRVSLNPDLIFVVMLPPLLFSAAFNTSWREFRLNLSTILSLAFGLVAFTALGVGLAAHWLIPGFDWRLGMVLGAVISPTDSIAATAIAKRLRLPDRIVDILEGESLVNDGTGLLAFEFAVAIVVSGHVPTIGETAWRLTYLTLAGIAVGLVMGKLVDVFERWIDNAPIEITASIIVPYLAYLSAEAIHTSGVLSVVACGLYLGWRSSFYYSSKVRLQSSATWDTLTFILNGITFLLIGLQLRAVVSGIRSVSAPQLAFSAAAVVLIVILLRLAWVFPGAYLSAFLSRKCFHRPITPLSPRGVFVTGWTGMRGVVSLAAAISLPEVLDDGSPFPQRNLIIFITFCVIFVTLVLQGLTLPALIRRLGLSRESQHNREEDDARRKMIDAALEQLEVMRKTGGEEFKAVYEHVAEHYRARLALLHADENEVRSAHSQALDRYHEITRDLRKTERSTVLKLRGDNAINDTVLRKLEGELDLLDVRYQ